VTKINNVSVASELLNVLINSLRPYYSMFMGLQCKSNITHLILCWFYCGNLVCKWTICRRTVQ